MSTGIQWTDETWNPVTGCSKVSPGCAHCYAEGVADRFWPSQYPPVACAPDDPRVAVRDAKRVEMLGALGQPGLRFREFEDVQFHEDRLDQPLHWRKPRNIFVNSMSDLFHESVPDAFIDRVFATMALAPQHTFQILTKRAERMRAYITTARRRFSVDEATAPEPVGDWKWPLPNVWLGVSVENQHFADERIPLLLQTPAAIRFISAEPLLAPVDLLRWLTESCCGNITDGDHENGEPPQCCGDPLAALSWVIVGGESGTGARPFDLAWARSIVKHCQAAGVPVFVKQLGTNPIDTDDFHDGTEACCRLTLHDRKGGDPAEWPEDLRVREMPTVRSTKETA